MGDILINPQCFLNLTTAAIKQTLYNLMIDSITYREIGNAEYEMRLFESEALETYLNKTCNFFPALGIVRKLKQSSAFTPDCFDNLLFVFFGKIHKFIYQSHIFIKIYFILGKTEHYGQNRSKPV